MPGAPTAEAQDDDESSDVTRVDADMLVVPVVNIASENIEPVISEGAAPVAVATDDSAPIQQRFTMESIPLSAPPKERDQPAPQSALAILAASGRVSADSISTRVDTREPVVVPVVNINRANIEAVRAEEAAPIGVMRTEDSAPIQQRFTMESLPLVRAAPRADRVAAIRGITPIAPPRAPRAEPPPSHEQAADLAAPSDVTPPSASPPAHVPMSLIVGSIASILLATSLVVWSARRPTLALVPPPVAIDAHDETPAREPPVRLSARDAAATTDTSLERSRTEVTIVSEPPGAEITYNGVVVGLTPLVIKVNRNQRGTVSFRAPMFLSGRRTIVPRTSATTVRLQLKRMPASAE